MRLEQFMYLNMQSISLAISNNDKQNKIQLSHCVRQTSLQSLLPYLLAYRAASIIGQPKLFSVS